MRETVTDQGDGRYGGWKLTGLIKTIAHVLWEHVYKCLMYTVFTETLWEDSIIPLLFYLFFWPHCTACKTLVPQPGVEPVPPPVEAQSLNHWSTRAVRLPFLDEEMAVEPSQTLCPRSPEKNMVAQDLLSTAMAILLSEMYFEGRFVYRQVFYYLEIYQPKFVLRYWLKAFWEQELAQRLEPQNWLRKTPRQPFSTEPSGGLFSASAAWCPPFSYSVRWKLSFKWPTKNFPGGEGSLYVYIEAMAPGSV